MAYSKNRPVYLNLLQIRFPAPAVLSILHRVSGVLMVLALPVAVGLLDHSLRDPESFAQVRGWLSSIPARLAFVLLGWALAHHVLAGIRFLLLDMDLLMQRAPARSSAWAVNLLGAAAALAVLGGVL